MSVKWQGYLLADYSESYTLHVQAFADAHFTLHIDGKLVMSNEFDQLEAKNDKFRTLPIDLAAGQLYSLELTYAKRLG